MRLFFAATLLFAISLSTPISAATNGASKTTQRVDKKEARRQANERERKALPKPPSDEPKTYAKWLAKLPKKMRTRIMRFCRNNPTHYQSSCGARARAVQAGGVDLARLRRRAAL